jgi:hypothetical protein
MASTITGTVASGVTIGSSSYTSPLTIAAHGAVNLAAGTVAVYSASLATVVNLGLVEATDTSTANGIVLEAGGTVQNKSGKSLIEAAADGVSVIGGIGDVTNVGTIEGSIGIVLKAGGNVVNLGSASLIEGTGGGINVSGGTCTITNAGTIEDTTAKPLNYDILLGTGGSVDNLRGGLIDNAFYGITVGGGSGTVMNFGTIAGSGVGISEDSIGASVSVVDGRRALIEASFGINVAYGTVRNAGTVEGEGAGRAAIVVGDGSVANTDRKSLIEGVGIGIAESYGTVRNAGTINSTGSEAVNLTDSGTIQNSGVIAGYSAGLYLIGAHGQDIVTNTGIIAATGTGAAGIELKGSGTVVTSGTIESIDGGDAVVFGGTIGGDLLVVDPGAVFVGNAVGDGSDSTLALAAGKSGRLLGLGTSFQSFGTITVDPKGVWSLSGDASGSELMNNGKIVVAHQQSLVLGTVSQAAHGTIELAGGAAEFKDSLAAEESLVFKGTGGFLRLDAPGSFFATISGFERGDTILLPSTTVTSVKFSKGKLVIIDGAKTIATLSLKGSYTTKDFAVTAFGSDTEITIGKPQGTLPVFVYADPGAGGDRDFVQFGFGQALRFAGGGNRIAPVGSDAAAFPGGVSEASPPLSWTSDPFHFWTIHG